DISLFTVFVYASITAIATGVGALPLYVMRKPSARLIALSGAVAAGLMGGASWGLMVEGFDLSVSKTILGALIGIVTIRLSHDWIESKDVKWGSISGADAKRIIMVVGVMFAHSFTEGVGVGVAFGGGERLAVWVTSAIALHNIPEGLAIALTMVPRGTSVARAGLWGIFSCLPQPLMAVPAFIFVLCFSPFLPVGLGF